MRLSALVLSCAFSLLFLTAQEIIAADQYETEPNDTMETADAVMETGTDKLYGQLMTTDDEDWYSFNVLEASIVNIKLLCPYASNDYYFYFLRQLYTDSGQILGSTDSPTLSVFVDSPGTYYLRIVKDLSWYDNQYQIEISGDGLEDRCTGCGIPAERAGDIDNDGKIGLTESIYALQVSAGAYPDLDRFCLLVGKDAWVTGFNYTECDVVTYDGSMYACTVPHTSATWESDMSNWILLSTEGPQGPAGTISADDVTLRWAEFPQNTASSITSEFGTVECNVGETLISATCSAAAPSFDNSTTNYGVLWTCDIAGNTAYGASSADALFFDDTLYGPPITIYAVCLVTDDSGSVATMSISTPVSTDIEAMRESFEAQAIKKQQILDSRR
ncbi:carbohydrate-binding protein [Desulfofustis glycolicus]|uniref:Chitin-binding type-3 domain-containing protein n=1 Tax=Desulfofustis glycolicus DSM 9705 TaxID=1121409 RepID=A0A1M5UKP9_9BACT|nr:carbohydrate-binding protein [Desulfofustis glycolicus]SHH63448.1 hypothetical protein SAMN02745124_01217 [Desulfofustis glycolicus DSM 9705]